MRKIDRFSYNFFNFKLYTLEMDKSFFKYEETEKEQNTQIENFYIPNSLTRLKEIVNLFKFISKDDEELKEPSFEEEKDIHSQLLKEKGTKFLRFTFLLKNDLDKIIEEI
ncbi:MULTISPECIES: hypothetical protein [Fusobacterium]|uniref:hypothetical protein n=1 Tax=Fusobacterium TaxID=848 RepID=UPI0008A6209A|nr:MULTISPECIES: hypothetical protein [Fusobacterium]OFL91664.1 hypothetical protein HMPREF2747_07305 [Fusobacterium sp. HMSC073F01]